MNDIILLENNEAIIESETSNVSLIEFSARDNVKISRIINETVKINKYSKEI